MYHAACKVEFQPFTVVLTADVFQLFIKLFIAILLFVVVKQYEVRSRRQLALSSAIPQGKHNQPCMVHVLVLQVRTYCALQNIRKTTTNSTIGKEKDHSLCRNFTRHEPRPCHLASAARRPRRGQTRTRARPSRLRAIAGRKPRNETRPSGGEIAEKRL